ncbi:MAG: hypothetical protein H6P95_935, partial [Candidatus Aminicenantes bacterium]|nr:hypothetical protein [Candidatus Aminicenantes bacterium]
PQVPGFSDGFSGPGREAIFRGPAAQEERSKAAASPRTPEIVRRQDPFSLIR